MTNPIDHLALRANLEPKSIAIQAADRQLNFRQLSSVVGKVADKLRQAGVRPGQVVLTVLPDKFLDWIVTLALFHEATISCSNHGQARPDASFEFDWMITDRVDERHPRARTIVIDQEWMDDATKRTARARRIAYASAQSLLRIVLTSGTTGHPKTVALTIEQVLSRSRNGIALRGANRTLSLLGLSTASDFNSSMDALICGLPLYCWGSAREALDMIGRFSIETVHGSPSQIARLIKEMAGAPGTIECLKLVRYAGGSASPALLANIETHLCRNIINLYGSTEAGNVCAFKPTSGSDPSIIGFPQIDVQIEVVDEAHRPVEQGADGAIRIKTSHMVHEYYRNPEATAQSFRDGWFYPGDRGRLTEDGLLVLAGRETELVNLGGVKVDPVSIEQFIAGWPGIDDAAVLGLANAAGAQEIVAAVVATDDVDPRALYQALVRKFGKAKSPARLFKVDRVPRNQMGKIMRAEMSGKLAALVGKER